MPASVRDVLLMIRTKEEATRALAGISREMRRAQATADAATARARATALRAQAEQARITGATKEQITALQRSARAYDQQASSIEKARRRHEMLTRAVTHGTEALTATGTAAIAAGAAVLYGLKQAVDVAAEYDRQTRLTFTQVDRRFKPSLIELGQIGRRVANEIAIPFEQIQPALFEVFSSTEANIKEAEVLLRAFSKAAVAGQTDVQTASRATIGLMNAYSLPVSKVNRLLDIQFQLVQEGVGTYEEWAQRIGLVTPSAVRANQSIETMAAALATATRMGTSAARAGTAVARAFDAISNPKTISNLERMGVKVRNARGELLPLVDILDQWREKLNKLPPKDRLESLLDTIRGAGSTIEARRFLQNMLLTTGGLELFQSILGEMEGDVGAFDRAYGEMANSVSSQSTILRNKWQLLKEAIGRALIPSFLDLIDKLQRVADWFNQLPESTQQTIARFALLAGIIGVVGGTILILLGSLGMLAIALAGITSTGWAVIGVATLIGAGLIALGIAFKKAYDESQPFRDVIESIKQLGIELWNTLKGFAQDVANEFRENLLPALRDLWTTIEQDVLPKVKDFVNWCKDELIPKVQEAGRIIADYLGQAFKFVAYVIENFVIPNIKKVIEKWDENKEELMPLIQLLLQLAKVFLIIVGIIVGSFIFAMAAASAVTMTFGGGAISLLLDALASVVNWIRTVIGWIKSLINWFRNLDVEWRGGARRIVGASNTIRSGIYNAFARLPGQLRNIGSLAAQGLAEGLRSRQRAVEGAGRALAAAAAIAARAAAEIRSPSRVFMRIGNMIVQGYINGILRRQRDVRSTMTDMAKLTRNAHAEQMAFDTGTPRPVGLGSQPRGGFMPPNPPDERGKLFDITINTQEIDPRKNAQDLGWELEGRLR